MESITSLTKVLSQRFGLVLACVAAIIASTWGFYLVKEHSRLATGKAALIKEQKMGDYGIASSKDSIPLKHVSETVALVKDELSRLCKQEGVSLTQVQTESHAMPLDRHPLGTKDLWHIHATFSIEGGPNSLLRVARGFSEAPILMSFQQFEIQRKDVVNGQAKTVAKIEIQALVLDEGKA